MRIYILVCTDTDPHPEINTCRKTCTYTCRYTCIQITTPTRNIYINMYIYDLHITYISYIYICIYSIYVYMHIPYEASAVAVLVVFLANGWDLCGTIPRLRCSFLCAGCGNSEGHVAPVYAEVLVHGFFAVKHNGFSVFCIKDHSGPLAASWLSLGAS